MNKICRVYQRRIWSWHVVSLLWLFNAWDAWHKRDGLGDVILAGIMVVTAVGFSMYWFRHRHHPYLTVTDDRIAQRPVGATHSNEVFYDQIAGLRWYNDTTVCFALKSGKEVALEWHLAPKADKEEIRDYLESRFGKPAMESTL